MYIQDQKGLPKGFRFHILFSCKNISKVTSKRMIMAFIVGRGVLTPPPLFYEDPPYIAYPPFLKFCSTPPPCRRQPPPPLLFLLSSFFDRMGDHATFDVLFCLMILWIHTCLTLVHQYQKDLDACFMQQGIKFTEVWHMWLFAGTPTWYHTNSHKHTHSILRDQ